MIPAVLRQTFCRVLSTVLPAILLSTPPALVKAATQPAAPDPQIVVEARTREAMHAFVAAMTDPHRDHQLARWDREVCPIVTGIDDPQSAFVRERIGAVAGRLGLRLGTSGCVSQMLIIVDNNAGAVAQALTKAIPVTLRKDGEGRFQRFANSAAPVRWITVTDPCGFDGCTLHNSRITKTERPALLAMIVVVDGKRLSGISLGALADYVTFVALGDPPMGETWPAGSIMALFDKSGPAQDSMSDADLAYLKALYLTRPGAAGEAQRSAIVHRMTAGSSKGR